MVAEAHRQPTSPTREELYEVVWNTPMSRLGERFGISGNGLAKICRRMEVPYPPRGYWAKKQAGKPVRSSPLPAAKATTLMQETIRPTPEPAPPPALSPEAEEVAAAVKAHGLRVPDRLRRPHPVVARWLRTHEQRSRQARSDQWGISAKPQPLTATNRRQHRILDTLFKELERQGARVVEDDQRALVVEAGGAAIQIQLREKLKQSRRPLTASERKWALPGDKGWRQELQPSGRLVFTIKTYVPGGFRQEWLEKDGQPLEDVLAEIAATILTEGPALAEHRRKQEEEERRRVEVQRQRRQDANRWRYFLEIAQTKRDIDLARSLLTSIKADNPDLELQIDGRTIGDWISRAEEHLDAADPLADGAASVFSSVAAITDWHYHQ